MTGIFHRTVALNFDTVNFDIRDAQSKLIGLNQLPQVVII